MTTQVAGTLDVARFIQDQPFGRSHVILLLLCSLVTFFDGQDFTALPYALPYIRDEWGIGDSATAWVAAAGNAGQMVGSLFGAYLADRVGRRPVIIACTFGSAILTTAVGFATSPDMITVLRFVSGLAIGGLLAPVWSLSIESMPRSMRATSVTIIMLGFSFGAASAAPIANWIAPVLGWQGIFWVCGAMTLAFALILLPTLPESARWLVAKEQSPERIRKALARFDSGEDHAAVDRFILGDERATTKSENPLRKGRELFVGALLYVTPLIWLAYFFSSIAIYLKNAYGVLFMEALGLARADAAWLSGASGLAGAIGGVALLAFTEKRGPGWIAIAPLLGIPTSLLVGYGYFVGGTPLAAALLFGAVFVGAGHAAVISITSIYYPSAVRSFGGGWASFMAKFGAVAAPFIGAWAGFLQGEAGARQGYVFTAACLLGIVVCVLVLARFTRRLPQGAPDTA
ncbi:MFS transporter [Erythrobacter arachoides]|uniref:MFS transporter n=1 Tax=Aurantiacibacter arachoides TaxID=1850444 RepID=A0A844ZX40_9SPHN|nr:MFS transporter [Aurantiacibacter arachoides]MXO92683.1 MFS transporter [Aurantiacibacter arachoides]GGD55260.1 MFS transporter [Aurantiacibacter arachoides]